MGIFRIVVGDVTSVKEPKLPRSNENPPARIVYGWRKLHFCLPHGLLGHDHHLLYLLYYHHLVDH